MLDRKSKTKRKCFPILADCTSILMLSTRQELMLALCYNWSTASSCSLWFSLKQFMGERTTSFVAVCSKSTCHLELSWSHLANRERSQWSWLQAALFSQLCYDFSEWVLTVMTLMTVPCFQLCLCKVCCAVPDAGKGSVFWQWLQCSKFEFWRRRSHTKPISPLNVPITRTLKKLHEWRYVLVIVYFIDNDSHM